MKLSTETKAGIMVACSFLGLTGVFVGKKFLDPDGKVEALVSETKTEGDPAKEASKGDSKGDGKGDAKAPPTEKEKPGEIVQTKSQVELPGGIPPLPGTTPPNTAIPTSTPAPVAQKDSLPGGLPPLPGTEVPPPKPMSGTVAKTDPLPAFPPPPGGTPSPEEKPKTETKSDSLGALPPPPAPTTGGGLPGGFPPLPGEIPPPSNPAKPALADGVKEKPGAVNSLPKNDKTDLKNESKSAELSKGFPPVPPPSGLGSGSGSGILGSAPPPPADLGSPDSKQDLLKTGIPASRGLGSSEFSPTAPSSFPLPQPKNAPVSLSNPPLGAPGLGGSTIPTSGLGSSGLGAPGLGGRIASAAVIPPVAVSTFSPTTGPIKRTEFIPIEEPPAAPVGNPGLPASVPGPMATPPTPAPTGLPDLPPGGLSLNSGATKSPGFNAPPAFASNTPPATNRPVLRMSGEEVKPVLQPAGLQYTPINPQPAKGNIPNPVAAPNPFPAVGSALPNTPSKVSSWTEKVYSSVSGDTWESISQAQYQRKDMGRMLQVYNELHPRLMALPKTGVLPANTEIFLPPAEELIRQGASVIPTPASFPNLGSAPAPLPAGNLPPPGPLPSGLGGKP